MLLPHRQRAQQEVVQSESLDEFQRQPRAAELPTVLHPYPRTIDLDEPRLGFGLRKQFVLPARLRIGRLFHTQPASLVHQPQVSNRPLSRTLRSAVRLDQCPIGFTLAIAPTVMGS